MHACRPLEFGHYLTSFILQHTQFLDRGQIKAIGTSRADSQRWKRWNLSVPHNYGIRATSVHQSTCPRDGPLSLLANATGRMKCIRRLYSCSQQVYRCSPRRTPRQCIIKLGQMLWFHFARTPQETNSRFRYEHYHYRFRHLSDACVLPKLVPFSGSVLATSESPHLSE
jgi:hypothetical protein